MQDSDSQQPENVVQRQLDAYNAHDLNALLAAYSEKAELFEHPSTLIASGEAALRDRFSSRLKEPNLHAHLLNRIVMGELVVDHERVARTFPEGPGSLELLMIYQVQDGKIRKVWSQAGQKTLDRTD